MWPFRKPPIPPTPLADHREWNDDWKVGDTAECVIDFDDWHPEVKPWNKTPKGARFTVIGFSEGANFGIRAYLLTLEGWPVRLATTAFRKVKPVATEQSEVVTRILNAKPGTDRVREEV